MAGELSFRTQLIGEAFDFAAWGRRKSRFTQLPRVTGLAKSADTVARKSNQKRSLGVGLLRLKGREGVIPNGDRRLCAETREEARADVLCGGQGADPGIDPTTRQLLAAWCSGRGPLFDFKARNFRDMLPLAARAAAELFSRFTDTISRGSRVHLHITRTMGVFSWSR